MNTGITEPRSLQQTLSSFLGSLTEAASSRGVVGATRGGEGTHGLNGFSKPSMSKHTNHTRLECVSWMPNFLSITGDPAGIGTTRIARRGPQTLRLEQAQRKQEMVNLSLGIPGSSWARL